MPVRTRAQARRPRRSALIIGSDYRGKRHQPTKYAVNDAYFIRNSLIEQRKFEEKDITVWTDGLPTGVFADADARITHVTSKMVLDHLMTLVRIDYSRPGDVMFFFYTGHSGYGLPQRVILGRNEKNGETNYLLASTLRSVATSVPAGVFFTVVLVSCGAPGMVPWGKIQFPFVYPPSVDLEEFVSHVVSDTVVVLTASSFAEQNTYGMNLFRPFEGGISYFAYSLIKVLERRNGPISHSELINQVSLFLVEFRKKLVVDEGLSDQFIPNTVHCPALLCADSQLDSNFLQM